MSQSDNSNTTASATSHPRVFYSGPEFRRGEFEVASEIADELGDSWRIVITIGPYKGYNLRYEIHQDAQVINLDFYSVRPLGGRYEVADVANAIERDIRSSH